MYRKLQDFQSFRKRVKTILFLFYLDLFFIILAFAASLMNTKYSKLLTTVFLSFELLFLVFTFILFIKNREMIYHIEDLFLVENNWTTPSKALKFQKLMDENLFHYHFQPIVNAKTGDIFAYEALMRTTPDTLGLNPIEILDYATKENCLYQIEKYTFYNVMKLMKDNSEIFQYKKLFINSVSSHQLTDADFSELYINYSSLFRNVVMEITESTLLSEDGIKLINKRLKDTNSQLALDDYGTGYSNESNLLNSNPNYIKIDGSLLRNINVDSKKQHIVSGLINFALQNNIKIIAEGIETYEEFEYVITLGVDYIQGFFTAKPSSVLISKISDDIIEKIQEISNRNFGDCSVKKLYETKGELVLSPVALALEMYTDIMITDQELRLQGNQGMVATISIFIPENHNCTLILDRVNLRGNDKSAIILGKNCSVVIKLIGDNYISYDGIRVPETSNLKIIGSGNLIVQAERTNRVGIGGNALQSYGNITLASTGIIKVISSGNMSVGIGGGQNPYNSLIHLESGNIYIETTGFNTVGVGSLSGNAKIMIDDCKLKIISAGTKAVGIGSLRGYIEISTSGNLIIKCDGKNAITIGALDDSDGNLIIRDGVINIRYSTLIGTGIGALGGKVSIDILKGDIAIYGEGTDIVGIGDHSGFSDIKIHNGTISIQLYAASAIPIGNIHRDVIIDGGNIQCEFPEDIIPVNSYGTPLVARIIMDTDEFKRIIDTVSYTYEYQASYSDRFPYIKVYLPDGVSF